MKKVKAKKRGQSENENPTVSTVYTTNKAEQHLQTNEEEYTDEQLQELEDAARLFAEIIYDNWLRSLETE